MPIKMTTTNAEIEKYLQGELAKRRQAVIRNLRYLGERCINEARDSGSYSDRTGNLRASIGYVVMSDGKPLGAPVLAGGSPEGEAQSRKTIEQVVSETTGQGLVLIVVAGMHYAKYVESRGYNVLTSAQLLAEEQVPVILNKLRLKWRKG